MKDIEEKNHLILNLVKQVKSIGYQLSKIPNDANLVHKTGDETIDGVKTFLKTLVAPGYSIPSGTPLQFLTADGAFFTYQTGPEDTFYKTDDIASHATSSIFYPSTKAIVDYVESVAGSLIRDEFNYSGSQTFNTTFPFGQVYEVIVNGVTASNSQYTLTPPNQVTLLDPLNAGDYIVIVYSQTVAGSVPYYTQAQIDALLLFKEDKANKQLTPIYDGTGVKYPALDLMNNNFLINTKLFSRTGIANKKDQFELIALNTTTLRIKQCDTIVFWEELFDPLTIANDALKTFPQLDYPLIQLVTPTGGNINVDPIVTPGLYVRYIGYDVDGHVISDSSDFSVNNTVAQLGVITVVYNAGVVSFLDMNVNGRNVFSQPILANTNDLQRANFVPTTSVTIAYNTGTPTLHSIDGVINGISINWRGANNVGNSLPIDRYAYTGVDPLPFVSIDASFLTSTSPLVTHTLWTDVVSGVAINSSFWNTTSNTRQAMLAGSFGIKQVVMGVRGGFFIQDPEFPTNACYATLAEAQANVYTHKFTDAVVPNTIAMSVARIIYKQGVTNFADPQQFQIVPTGLGSGSGGGVVPPVGDATTVSKGIVQLAGDLSGTASAPTVPTKVSKTGDTMTGDLIMSNSKGIVLQSGIGTNRDVRVYASSGTDNYAFSTFYPNSGTNVGAGFFVIPKGTGFSAGSKTQFAIYNTDYIADSGNYEALQVAALGSNFNIGAFKAGTGTARPISITTQGNTNQLWLLTNGRIVINSASDDGNQFQVAGTSSFTGTGTASTYKTLTVRSNTNPKFEVCGNNHIDFFRDTQSDYSSNEGIIIHGANTSYPNGTSFLTSNRGIVTFLNSATGQICGIQGGFNNNGNIGTGLYFVGGTAMKFTAKSGTGWSVNAMYIGDTNVNNEPGVSIGTETMNSSTKFNVVSTTMGTTPFPRMTAAQRTAISSPATGLFVYQTDAPDGLYMKKSTAWERLGLASENPWVVSGNNIYNSNTGSVMIGNNPNPITNNKLDVYSVTQDSLVFNVEGTQGQLFSVTDTMTGWIHYVNDISGLPIFRVNSNEYQELYGEQYYQPSTVTGGLLSAITTTTVLKTISLTENGGSAFYFDYFVKNTSTNAMRSGTIMVVTDGTNLTYTDSMTTDLNASTAGITLVPSISSGSILLTATVTSGTWNTKANTRIL